MRRLLLLLVLIFGWIAPAQADDISASQRGVVRIVVIAVVGDEVVGFSHGSGFAVGPNRIVTNAHVVELASRYPDNVVIGVVPSEGSKSFQGRLVKIDPGRDLALIDFTGVRLPPLTLFKGTPGEGDSLVALGYPGNVDVATAQSAKDFITPMSPVRSQGGFAGMRTVQGTAMLLHTANIARGNSGGPLLDRCGRVLGVNALVTNGEQGDSNFALAVSQSELAAFLTEAKQSFQSVAVACVSVEERMAQDRNADEQARAAAEEAKRQGDARSAAERENAIQQARATNEATRENYMAIAALLLVAGGLCVGGGVLLMTRGRQKEGVWVLVGGGVLFVGAVALFLSRPNFDPNRVVPITNDSEAAAEPEAALGKMVCTLDPSRSRVTVSTVEKVELDIGPDGCINGRTQYSEDGKNWLRVLVPEQDATVSVLDYDPQARTYTNTRYMLSADQMTRARQLRTQVTLKVCSSDQAARGQLATRQQEIRAALPPAYNEKLVYHCAAAPPK
ncbi:serine protease [Sphingomonas sp. LB-2]|uniref:S1 family peptidase n=1 Tax=Sphingomonas caeni TaxID=2984949 RepID=UPI00222EF790|nr:serine protease [Sphingomonas caeni]MCW3849469.1 serine protease [Sphingomonas caeni]